MKRRDLPEFLMKFFSIPGMRPHQAREGSRPLPDIHEHPQTAEWARTRGETSHGVLGLDQGMEVNLDLHGERRKAVVLAEEGDRKTGNAAVYVRSEGSRGSEIHKVEFVPDGPRSMIQPGHPKKVRRAP